jgi:hypothetical protein
LYRNFPDLSMSLFQKFLATPARNRYDKFMIDGFAKSPSAALQLRKGCIYPAPSPSFCAPCIWSFLPNHCSDEILRDHHDWPS